MGSYVHDCVLTLSFEAATLHVQVLVTVLLQVPIFSSCDLQIWLHNNMIIVVTIIIITIIIILIIITLKGAIRDFLLSPHCAANCLQHVHSSGLGTILCKLRATHRALITCNMSCYVPCGTKGQLSY